MNKKDSIKSWEKMYRSLTDPDEIQNNIRLKRIEDDNKEALEDVGFNSDDIF